MSAFVPVRRLLAVASLAIAPLAACSDSAAPDTGPVALSFAARGDVNTHASGASAGAQGTIVISAGGTDTLRLTSVRLVIDEVELLQSAGGTCPDDSHHGAATPGCIEIEMGPYLVDLPVNGGVASVLTMPIPAGTYAKLEMKLRQADSGGDRAFIATHPEMNGISVVASGMYRGRAFTWRGDVDADLEMYFSPALAVDGAGNVTVNIDVGRWFRSATGGIIDPAAAGPGQPGFATVASNIAASFGAFCDDDRDGHDDHRNDD